MSSRKLPLFILNKGEWLLFWNVISMVLSFIIINKLDVYHKWGI